MLTLLGKLKGKKVKEFVQREAKCPCGEVVMRIPCEEREMYLCKSCNKLLYYVDAPLKIRPLSLGWLKRR